MEKSTLLRKFLVGSILLAFFIITSGCSTPTRTFNDDQIKIKLVSSQSDGGFKSYVFEIENAGELPIEYVTFYLNYPILLSNGSKNNPFKIEALSEKNPLPVIIKSHEKIRYSVFAPIKEVFGNTNRLDFEHPSIELKGYVLNRNEHIPFSMSGSLEVFERRQ